MKILIASIFILAAATEGFSQEKQLGLADRRALKKYQDEKLPELKKAIDAAAGFSVELDIKWEKIARPGEGERYNDDDYWTNIYFVPLTGALKSIATDEMGKSGLKAGLKKVVIDFDEKTAPASNYPNGLKLENKTLFINFTPYSNVADIKEREKAIKDLLESKL
ncbi:MAG: hypothetical protein HY22_02915 [[Candidatus Thermochlorobacteriaceae] bacterium GBChlB]|nr:MAG: hypothetical protein HY22_02915 [[Candidatus Thermochlorobacteriaceae] bacterium GBChlB]